MAAAAVGDLMCGDFREFAFFWSILYNHNIVLPSAILSWLIIKNKKTKAWGWSLRSCYSPCDYLFWFCYLLRDEGQRVEVQAVYHRVMKCV